MAVKIKLTKGNIILKLYNSQGGIRISDEEGNQVAKPTQALNENKYYIEWMITNDEIGLLSKHLFSNFISIINEMKKISKFAEDSKYSRRTTKKGKEKIATFENFDIYKYSDEFHSFEKTLNSGIKVRLTFKLGDFGITAHPHMYVLVPFNFKSMKIKNKEGDVKNNEPLGSGCYGELILTANELKDIILTLSHASNNHRNSLIEVLIS